MPRTSLATRAVVGAICAALTFLLGVAIPTTSATAAPGALPGAAAYDPINGSGSTWSANALTTWVGDVASNGVRVNFSAVGSVRGRKEFADRATVFGISETPYTEGRDERSGSLDSSMGRPFTYMPIVAGGTAFMYHVKVGGVPYRGLRLSGDTIAKIFTGRITDWSDPAITRDNNGKALPKKKITVVARSDGSGTTAQFTTWLSSQYGSLWKSYYGKNAVTSYWPNKPGVVLQSGSDQVAGYIAAGYGDGAIGYVEYSYAKAQKDWPVAKVQNAAGYYTLPTDYNVAVALTRAEIETQNKDPRVYLTQKLRGVYRNPDPRTYPLSSYSYMIVPTDTSPPMSTGKGRTLSAFAFYFLCEGQQKAGPLGYSPLPLNLVQAGFAQVKRVPGAENQNLNPSKCRNPTFDMNNPSRNLLAVKAPAIPACDKVGQGPCGAGGGQRGSTDKPGAAGKGGGAAGGAGSGGTAGPGAGTGGGPAATGPGASGTGPGATGGPGAIDPETGLPVNADNALYAGGPMSGTAAELSAFRDDTPVRLLAGLAAAEFLLVLLAPAIAARILARRRQAVQAP